MPVRFAPELLYGTQRPEEIGNAPVSDGIVYRAEKGSYRRKRTAIVLSLVFDYGVEYSQSVSAVDTGVITGEEAVIPFIESVFRSDRVDREHQKED